jgi:16S rRNA (cytosine1402-N4)-methyltransferase
VGKTPEPEHAAQRQPGRDEPSQAEALAEPDRHLGRDAPSQADDLAEPDRHPGRDEPPHADDLACAERPLGRDEPPETEALPGPEHVAVMAEALPGPEHVPVMAEPVLEALRPRGAAGFRALDCTVGAGGHSFGLLERSGPDGQLVGLDVDPGALALASNRLARFGERVTLLNRNFGELADLDVAPVDSVVFDLGLSSMQLESGGRGFSFRHDEPLDMRFDPSAPTPTAAELLNALPEGELERILHEYGEEPRARRVARSIAYRRAQRPFTRTGDLVAAVIAALGPARGRIHPATRTFQALRIAVNDELRNLEGGLDAAVQLLTPGGRIAVISFHSLEDRIVKWRFRHWAETGQPARVRILTRKPTVPDAEEIQRNPRARSAKLRVAERLS